MEELQASLIEDSTQLTSLLLQLNKLHRNVETRADASKIAELQHEIDAIKDNINSTSQAINLPNTTISNYNEKSISSTKDTS